MAKEKEQTKSAGTAAAEPENGGAHSEPAPGNEQPKYLAVFTDGSYPISIGVAYPQSNGSWLVKTRAMPAPVEGYYKMWLRRPKQQTQQ